MRGTWLRLTMLSAASPSLSSGETNQQAEGFLYHLGVVTLTVCVCLGLISCSQSGQSANVAAGRELFYEHCSVCHGVNGKGNGAAYVAASTGGEKAASVDLTLLTQRNSGTFPVDRVHDAIDIKSQFPAHGTPDNPAWGNAFSSSQSDPELREHRIEFITSYIQSLQAAGK